MKTHEIVVKTQKLRETCGCKLFLLRKSINIKLIVVGEWMPVTVFKNENGKLANKTSQFFDKSYSGWWNTISVGDFNSDGKPDLIIGNMGLNTQFNATEKEPLELYYMDFDKNGSVDPIFSFYIQNKRLVNFRF